LENAYFPVGGTLALIALDLCPALSCLVAFVVQRAG
jgi:hypothetical protein